MATDYMEFHSKSGFDEIEIYDENGELKSFVLDEEVVELWEKPSEEEE